MSLETQSEVPSVKEELERKTVDLLENLVHRSESLRLDKRTLAFVAKQLWHVTSGLVDKGISDLCGAVALECTKETLARRFVGKGTLVVVVWLPDKPGYNVVKINPTTLERTVAHSSKEDVTTRGPQLEELFAALVKSGYQEI